MKLAYDRLKGLKVIHNEMEGTISGFSNDKLIASTTANPHYSFRRLEDDSFIEPEYKDTIYRYFYVNESFAEKQNGISYTVQL